LETAAQGGGGKALGGGWARKKALTVQVGEVQLKKVQGGDPDWGVKYSGGGWKGCWKAKGKNGRTVEKKEEGLTWGPPKEKNRY